jgi:hypothetical protein
MSRISAKIALAIFVVCISALVATPPANATIVQFAFNNIAFNDGGTATGSFLFDTSTDIVSNLNFTSTAGSISPGPGYGILPGFSLTGGELVILVRIPFF